MSRTFTTPCKSRAVWKLPLRERSIIHALSFHPHTGGTTPDHLRCFGCSTCRIRRTSSPGLRFGRLGRAAFTTWLARLVFSALRFTVVAFHCRRRWLVGCGFDRSVPMGFGIQSRVRCLGGDALSWTDGSGGGSAKVSRIVPLARFRGRRCRSAFPWAVAPVVGMSGFWLGCLFVRGLGDAAWPEPSVCGGAGMGACTRVFGVFGCL